MTALSLDIAVYYNDFDKIANELQPRADAVSRKTAFDIQADYQSNARRDTGAQVNSAYVVTETDSTYSAAVSAAQSANAKAALLSEIQATPHQAIVAVGVEYAIFNEYGSHGKAGDGALTRAAERQRQSYFDALRQMIEQSGR